MTAGKVYAAQLARELAERLEVSPHFARGILSTFRDIVVSHLLAGRSVSIPEFGLFKLKKVGRKRMRVGVANTKEIVVGGHSVPGWRPFDSLKQRVREATKEPSTRDRRRQAGAGTPSPAPAAPVRRKGAARG